MPPPPPFVSTQNQKNDAARFVVYEQWMLRECANMPKPSNQAEKNVWFEGTELYCVRKAK